MDQTRDADVVVIGAGPSGLTTAAYLAQAGQRVVVVEARDVPGGHVSSYTRGGYEQQIGLHFTSPDAVGRVLGPLGVDVPFRDFAPGAVFTLYSDHDALEVPDLAGLHERLRSDFPAEQAAVDGFFTAVREIFRELSQVSEQPRLRDLPSMPWHLRAVLRHSRTTLGGFLDGLHASPALRERLGFLHGALALPPSQISFVAYAMSLVGLLQHTGYPEGGHVAITTPLTEVVRRHGGELLLGTEVTEILTAAGRVHGVRTAPAAYDAAPSGGLEILAPVVVSAVDVKQTFLHLLAPGAVAERVLRRVRGFRMAGAWCSVCLVLDRDLAAEGLKATNGLVLSGDSDAAFAAACAGRLSPDPMVGLWPGSIVDPGDTAMCRPGQTALHLYALAPSSHTFWGIEPGGGRTARYRARKREVRDLMVARAGRAVADLEASIAFEDTATPVTEERFMRVTDGTAMGIALTPRQLVVGRPGAETPVAGLYLAGVSTRSGPGVSGALESGVAAAATVTGQPVAELLGPEPAHAVTVG